MDTYNYQESSKKKWLVPIVVLFVCAAAMTGAAFAYNSTITGSGSGDVDYITLDFEQGDVGTYNADTMNYTASAALTFNHVKSFNKDTQKIEETYTVIPAVLFTIKVVLKNEASESIDDDHSAEAPTIVVTSESITGLGLTIDRGDITKVTGEDAWTCTVSVTGSCTTAPMKTITDFVIVATSPTLSD